VSPLKHAEVRMAASCEDSAVQTVLSSLLNETIFSIEGCAFAVPPRR
jgi:hypothetical protein